jgi:peptidoglycan/xylan/chitin deacetylase (PgdA/CDA1 family)
MIRNTVSVGTTALIPGMAYPPIVPVQERAADIPGLFTHARREGLREVGLCFDLYDDDTGLSAVLDELRIFGVRATFFLNGEFISRNPGAVRDIVQAGHEAASLFFAPSDLTDARYQIQGDFIARGLARNEDEFHKASGSELELLWHAPYYAVSPEIISAASRVGYKTIGRDVDPRDWVEGSTQDSAAETIDRIMAQKQPGSIIPIRLGLLPGGRGEYLFSRAGLLLNALIREGYSVVPISTLLEHAR